MKLENYPIKELKKKIIDIVSKHLDINKYEVFFFGSRVSGKSDQWSDIDLGIEGDLPVPIDRKMKIEEEISNIETLYKIEVIDFAQVSEDFKKVAKKDIERLN